MRVPNIVSSRVVLGILVALALQTAPSAHAINVNARHGLTGDEYQELFDDLGAEGYRPISLSVYDESPHRYAAVWVQEPGPEYAGFHGLNVDEYVETAEDLAEKGFRPQIVTAHGDSGGSAVFAGIFVRDGLDDYGLWANLTADEFEQMNADLDASGYYLEWMDAYGTDENPLYLGIWLPNDNALVWRYTERQSSGDFQETFDASTAWWVRPRMIPVSGGSTRYSGVWHDDSIGLSEARHGLTESEYQATTKELWAEGLYPINVQAGGTGDEVRFAAIFARQHHIQQRFWHEEGPLPLTLAGVDDAVEQFMRNEGIRGGQLAIAYDGRLVCSRAYTWAESWYPRTSETSLFRIASSSKPLTSLAIWQLIEEGAIQEDDPMQDILALAPPDPQQSVAGWLGSVQVTHLLHHQGGWNNQPDDGEGLDAGGVVTFGRDPMFNDLDFVDNWGYGWTLPITKYQVAAAMSTTMQFQPGTAERYSNLGYSLLGQIIEAERSLPYEQALHSTVFGPLGVTRPRIGQPFLEDQPGEVRYHADKIALRSSVMDEDRDLVPVIYGGYNLQNLDAHGGWVLAAVDFAKVLASFDLNDPDPTKDLNPIMDYQTREDMFTQTIGNSYNGWWRTDAGALVSYGHNGALGGSRSEVFRTTNKISVVLIFNKNSNTEKLKVDILNMLDAVPGWPIDDYFPNVGIPPFERPTSAVPTTTSGSSSVPIDPVRGDATLTLDGRGSRGDGPRLTYLWEVLGEFGRVPPPQVHDPRAPLTDVTFFAPGRYEFRLTVQDGRTSDSATIVVEVTDGPDRSIAFRRGDVDASGVVDIGDAMQSLLYLFLGRGEPACLEAADIDDNGEVDVADVVRELDYLFLGGKPPAAPGPRECGVDSNAPFLGCEQSACEKQDER